MYLSNISNPEVPYILKLSSSMYIGNWEIFHKLSKKLFSELQVSSQYEWNKLPLCSNLDLFTQYLWEHG